MKRISASHTLLVFVTVLLIFTVVGCSTVTVIDRSSPSATQLSRAEAMEVLKKILTDRNRFVELDEVGYRCREKMGVLGIPAPWSEDVVFAEVTKISTTQGAQGDWVAIYGKGGKHLTTIITGRDDAYNNRVASALLVLCPNIK